MKTLELKLPTPVLLVWGLPEDAHDSLIFMGGRILTYDTGANTVAIRLSRSHDEYWELIGNLSELTDTDILRSIADRGYYFTNPYGENEPELEPECCGRPKQYRFDEPPECCGIPAPTEESVQVFQKWKEAQSKTLPANTLIFKRV